MRCDDGSEIVEYERGESVLVKPTPGVGFVGRIRRIVMRDPSNETLVYEVEFGGSVIALVDWYQVAPLPEYVAELNPSPTKGPTDE